jgi:hypothetical protein
MDSAKRFFSYSLLSLLLFHNILSFQQKALGFQQTINLQKSLFEEQNYIAQSHNKICLRNFCTDKSYFTETFLAKPIQEFVEKNAPVTASNNNLYPLVSSLPGSSFRPNILNIDSRWYLPPRILYKRWA